MRGQGPLAVAVLAVLLAAPAASAAPSALPDPFALVPSVPRHAAAPPLRVTPFAGLPAAGATLAGADDGDGAWGVVPTPAPRTELGTRMYGTSCPAADDCWAVGWTSNGASTVALAEHWDGRAWTPVPTPAAATHGLTIYGLDAVTCVSPDACWAVGTYYDGAATNRPLVERWDGRSWSLVDAPGTGGVDVPLGVTCTSSADCWMVGYSFLLDCPSTGCGFYTLAEHWDGRAWRRESSPNPFLGSAGAAPLNILRSVACRVPRDCWAVGYVNDGTRYAPLTAHWDGAAWRATGAPAGVAAGGAALLGVACPATASCWAAGLTVAAPGQSAPAQPFIARADGMAWTTATSALPAGLEQGELASVSCAPAGDCVAVGDAADAVSGARRALIERWDGSAWRSTPATSPSSANGTLLDAVSCASAGSCTAVGTSPNSLGVPQPLATRLDRDAWQTTLTEFRDEASAAFRSVACPAPGDCWAVGYDTARYRPLVARWDGDRWGVVAAPADPSASGEGLFGVGCATTSECWAVGWSAHDGGAHPLIVRWSGGRWTRIEAPVSTTAVLQGVACASASDCWAVGRTLDDAVPTRPLLVHWDGARWTSVAVDAAPTQADGYLAGVTCVGPADCWAVGGWSDAASYQTLAEHWNGTTWTSTDTGGLGLTNADGLQAVTCRSASDCWAVGGRDPGGGVARTLAAHWDGSAWTRHAPAADGVLYGVSCRAATRCWAVGAHGAGASTQPLLARWDGRAWSSAQPPVPGSATGGESLLGVACARGDAPDCWAVGSWADRTQLHTLAAHYPAPAAAGAAASPTAAAQRRAAAKAKRCRVRAKRKAARHRRGHRRRAKRHAHSSAACRRRAPHRAKHRHRHRSSAGRHRR